MAHGLETRVPFLDNDLVDFAMRVPVNMKLGNLGEVVRLNENEPGRKTRRYFEKTKDGKLLLRRVLGRYVPEDISDAEKQGFSAPDASWFRGESIDYVRSMLLDPGALIYDLLDRKAVVALIQEHLEGPAEPTSADLVAVVPGALVPTLPAWRPGGAGPPDGRGTHPIGRRFRASLRLFPERIG